MNTGKIKLSHFSVKEYLLSAHVEEYFRIDEKTSHSKIAQLSIAYLLQFDDDSSPITRATFDSMPLTQYVAEHWIGHVKSARGIGPTVLQLILHLFTSDSAPLKNWIWVYNIDDIYSIMGRPVFYSALYYSSLAGMEEVTGCLLHKGENANVEGGRYGNALQAASYEGNMAIVKLLLESGAEVNAVGGHYGNEIGRAHV